MKTTKKIIALMMALVMVLGMSTAAMADVGPDGIDTQSSNILSFEKSILMKNANSSSVREPNIVYTYTITDPGISGKKVTNTDGLSAQVYSIGTEGTANVSDFDAVLPTKTATVTFADSNQVSTSETGVETSETVKFTFDGTKFPHAGIYRFLVTETFDRVSKASVGIVEGTGYSNQMYLDVYVTGTGGTSSIYGFVLFEANANTDITERDEEQTKAHEKSAGWCSGGSTDNYVNQDIYETYDVEIAKTTDGDNSARNHDFPFVVSIGGTLPTNKIDMAVTGGSLTTTTPLTLSSTNEIYVGLKDGGKLTITGIPSASVTTITVRETNDTYDVYTITPTINGTAGTATVKQNAESLTISPVSIAAHNLTKQTIAFENKLTSISPTGYVSRYAPYGLILVVGVVLMLIAVKRRKHHDEED